jgi:hypothetical protein
VTVHEIQKDGTLQELHHASGGCWGGATVDDEFWLLLVKIFGSDVMKEASMESFQNFLELRCDFSLYIFRTDMLDISSLHWSSGLVQNSSFSFQNQQTYLISR